MIKINTETGWGASLTVYVIGVCVIFLIDQQGMVYQSMQTKCFFKTSYDLMNKFMFMFMNKAFFMTEYQLNIKLLSVHDKAYSLKILHYKLIFWIFWMNKAYSQFNILKPQCVYV